jgi:hypothetical protein
VTAADANRPRVDPAFEGMRFASRSSIAASGRYSRREEREPMFFSGILN